MPAIYPRERNYRSVLVLYGNENFIGLVSTYELNYKFYCQISMTKLRRNRELFTSELRRQKALIEIVLNRSTVMLLRKRLSAFADRRALLYFK